MENLVTADLHCDLLSYLQEAPDANPMIKGGIGCTIPDLLAGQIKFQVMAIYTATGRFSTKLAREQAFLYKGLLNHHPHIFNHFDVESSSLDFKFQERINTIIAIENAACICSEDEDLKQAIVNLNNIISLCGKPLYLGLTHHGENRFGGGNNTSVGLKDDGKVLIAYLAQQSIALDFSHTSDYLAYDILNFISKENIKIPIIASHSNFRAIYFHNRNLPDDIAKEIIKENGIIGINLLRAFLNPENENALYDHILHGIELGGLNNLCLGADYFYCDSHPDQTRQPFFFSKHDAASKYPEIINTIANMTNNHVASQFSCNNLISFIENKFRKRP
jgi:microsomal dipeptidase-like Zn-dependent dipeptidase